MSITETLASHLALIRYDMLSEKAIQKARHCLIDYLGACWNAQTDSLTHIYRRLASDLGGEGDYHIFGSGKTSIGFAALANGAIGHIKEVDDLHRGSTMHVGITVFPALLAVAEQIGFNGVRFIESTVAGYEAAIRIGEALGREHYKIFHTTGTAGTFGAAVAVGKYLGLTAEQLVDALGHAGTQAAGLWQFLSDGDLQAKALHPGKAAQNGLIAAWLSKLGVSGARNILEGEKGFARIAAPKADLAGVVEGLGNGKFKIEDICFKNYPTCGQTHSMLDALRMIMRREHLTGIKIKSVEARVYQQALDLCSNRNPINIAQGRFSLPYCMGIMLAKGDLTFSDMNEELLSDLLVRAELEKVSMKYDPEVDALFPKTRPCVVVVTTNDNKRFEMKNLYRRGDPELPMSDEDVRSKFVSLTQQTLGRAVQEKILKWALNLENEAEVCQAVFSGC